MTMSNTHESENSHLPTEPPVEASGTGVPDDAGMAGDSAQGAAAPVKAAVDRSDDSSQLTPAQNDELRKGVLPGQLKVQMITLSVALLALVLATVALALVVSNIETTNDIKDILISIGLIKPVG